MGTDRRRALCNQLPDSKLMNRLATIVGRQTTESWRALPGARQPGVGRLR